MPYLQKKDGVLFLEEFFDIFKYKTVELIYFLYFYNEVYSKPYTSRYANSERYLICKKYKFTDVDHLVDKLATILRLFKSINNNADYNSCINFKRRY